MPVSVFLTRMPACKGNAVWLTGGYIPKDCRLRQLWKEKVSTENVRCGCVWKESSWQVERCWEILHRGDDSSEKREVHKWLPGAILLCQEGRHKKNCFFQILPFQLKPQGSWHILSWCFFYVSYCYSEFFLSCYREALHQHNFFYYNAMSYRVSLVHIRLTWHCVCVWTYMDTYYHKHHKTAFIECSPPY